MEDAFQLLKADLEDPDIEIVIDAVNKLTIVAASIGPERISRELIPYLATIVSFPNDEVLASLGRQLYNIWDIAGQYKHVSYEQLSLVVRIILALAQEEEVIVRQAAVEAANMIAPTLNNDDITTLLVPVFKQLATSSEWFGPRGSAAQIAPILYSLVKDDALRHDIWAGFLALFQDETPMVRRLAALSIPTLITGLVSVYPDIIVHVDGTTSSAPPTNTPATPIVHPRPTSIPGFPEIPADYSPHNDQSRREIIISELIPLLQPLALDERDYLRDLSPLTLIPIIPYITLADFRTYIIPILHGLSDDHSWRVRQSLCQAIPTLLLGLIKRAIYEYEHGNDETRQLLQHDKSVTAQTNAGTSASSSTSSTSSSATSAALPSPTSLQSLMLFMFNIYYECLNDSNLEVRNVAILLLSDIIHIAKGIVPSSPQSIQISSILSNDDPVLAFSTTFQHDPDYITLLTSPLPSLDTHDNLTNTITKYNPIDDAGDNALAGNRSSGKTTNVSLFPDTVCDGVCQLCHKLYLEKGIDIEHIDEKSLAQQATEIVSVRHNSDKSFYKRAELQDPSSLPFLDFFDQSHIVLSILATEGISQEIFLSDEDRYLDKYQDLIDAHHHAELAWYTKHRAFAVPLTSNGPAHIRQYARPILNGLAIRPVKGAEFNTIEYDNFNGNNVKSAALRKVLDDTDADQVLQQQTLVDFNPTLARNLGLVNHSQAQQNIGRQEEVYSLDSNGTFTAVSENDDDAKLKSGLITHITHNGYKPIQGGMNDAEDDSDDDAATADATENDHATPRSTHSQRVQRVQKGYDRDVQDYKAGLTDPLPDGVVDPLKNGQLTIDDVEQAAHINPTEDDVDAPTPRDVKYKRPDSATNDPYTVESRQQYSHHLENVADPYVHSRLLNGQTNPLTTDLPQEKDLHTLNEITNGSKQYINTSFNRLLRSDPQDTPEVIELKHQQQDHQHYTRARIRNIREPLDDDDDNAALRAASITCATRQYGGGGNNNNNGVDDVSPALETILQGRTLLVEYEPWVIIPPPIYQFNKKNQIISRLQRPALIPYFTFDFPGFLHDIGQRFSTLPQECTLLSRLDLIDQISIISPLLGYDYTHQYIVPTIWAYAQDEHDDIRSAVVLSLQRITMVFEPEKLADGILPLVQALAADPRWKVRHSVATILSILARYLPPEHTQNTLLPIIRTLLTETVHAVRNRTAAEFRLLTNILGIDIVLRQFLPAIILLYDESSNYLLRITAVHFVYYCATAYNNVCPSSTIVVDFGEFFFTTLSDPVPNIRILSTRYLIQLLPIIVSADLESNSSLGRVYIERLSHIFTAMARDPKDREIALQGQLAIEAINQL